MLVVLRPNGSLEEALVLNAPETNSGLDLLTSLHTQDLHERDRDNSQNCHPHQEFN
jgi:hypothetical protein